MEDSARLTREKVLNSSERHFSLEADLSIPAKFKPPADQQGESHSFEGKPGFAEQGCAGGEKEVEAKAEDFQHDMSIYFYNNDTLSQFLEVHGHFEL